jgi:hypothetical protein
MSLINIKPNKKLIFMISITVSLMTIIFKGLIGRHVPKTMDIKGYYFSLIFKIIARYEYIFNMILEERICFLGFWNVGHSMIFLT